MNKNIKKFNDMYITKYTKKNQATLAECIDLNTNFITLIDILMENPLDKQIKLKILKQDLKDQHIKFLKKTLKK
jgi:hypothetical protein